MVIVILQVSIISASSEPLDSDIATVEFNFDESSYSYEIGFTKSESTPEESKIATYTLSLGDDGRGHDNDDLFFYWEITGKNFVVELTGSDLKSGDDSLSLDISWTGKEENSNVILASDDSVYSGKGAIELDLSTAPVTEAAIGTYDTTLKLTIRRTS